MSGTPPDQKGASIFSRRSLTAAFCAAAGLALTACGGGQFGNFGDFGNFGQPGPAGQQLPPQAEAAIGTGEVRVGLILPLSAQGNAGVAAQSMKNAAQLALAEFKNPNIQLLVKDDAGTPQGAQAGAQQALSEGAQIILGPLFAESVRAVAQVARPANVPMIAFSTDSSVAASGVYLLSFLPETDVKRIVDYAAAHGRRSFAALIPDNAYGAVVQGAFQQEVPRRGGRVIVLQKYPLDPSQLAAPVSAVAQEARRVDSIFIPDTADSVVQIAQALAADRVDLRREQLLGTGLWQDEHIFATQALHGALYPGPDPTSFRNFSARYRARFGQDPVRTASLAYDAVALVAALVKTQGARPFTEQILTNASGFAGIDGIFRFRNDGSNERGLAVLRVTPTGGQVVSPAPKSFGPGT
jgi:ABC-type branched-subunit amino acid transport system substrate-binding protein